MAMFSTSKDWLHRLSIAAAGPDRELHVFDLNSAPVTEVAVTTGATATLSHGTAEFVAQEEMSRPRGYWWSPESHDLLCQETDESQVETRYVADALHPDAIPPRPLPNGRSFPRG